SVNFRAPDQARAGRYNLPGPWYWSQVKFHVVTPSQDRAVWLLEIADHVGPYRRTIDFVVGRAARRWKHLLAGRAAAGAGPVGGGARRRGPGADRHDSSAIQRAHARARIRRRLVDRVGRRRHLLQLRRRPSLSSGA